MTTIEFLTTSHQLPIEYREDLERDGLAAWYVVTRYNNGRHNGRLSLASYYEHPSKKAAQAAMDEEE